MRKGILLLLLAVSIGTSCKAQDSTRIKVKPMVGISLVHVMFKGLKVDGMIPVSKDLLVYLSPEYYKGNLSWQDEGKLSGFGAEAGVRYIFWDEMNKESFSLGFAHLSYGYNQFRIDTEDEAWVEKVQNGQNILVREMAPVYKQYDRQSVNIMLGILWKSRSNLYIESNLGLSVRGVKRSFSEGYFPAYQNDDFSWSYGYEGIAPVIGFRMGFMFR